MLRKVRDISELIDFSKTSESPALIKIADDLLLKLKVERKHLPRKRQILINLIKNLLKNYSRGINTTIPRSENFYSKNTSRYKPENMSHDIVVDLIDRMKSQNKYVIEYFKGKKNELDAASQYYPSDLLIEIAGSIISESMTLLDEECILLRKRVSKIVNTDTDEPITEEAITSGLHDEGQLTKDYMKILVDYNDTDYTNRMRHDLTEYNKFRLQNRFSLRNLPPDMFNSEKYNKNIARFSSINIKLLKPDSMGFYQVPLAPDSLVRIFTQDFEHGGRFYRGFETQLKKELRPYIAINDCPTVEYDYSSYHIRMIYHLTNKRCPEDPYVPFKELDLDEGRDYYKTMVATCLNNDNEKSVLRTMRQYIVKHDLIDNFRNLTDEELKNGLNLLLHHNRLIASHFFKADGLKYHKFDSDIANDILMHFTRLRTPVLALCVHDSFVVAEEHENELIRVMNKFYKARVGKQPKIK